MSFASAAFLVFFLSVLLITAILERHFPQKVRQGFLLLASYFFYGYWDWRFCFLLLFVTVVSYYAARAKRKSFYVLGIIVPLIVLGVFKYLNFFVASFAAAFGVREVSLEIILPVGISFYTFQALSYVIDVHRGRIPAEKSFLKVALYLSFFPQLVAGPIVKAADFLPQLDDDRRVTKENIRYGVQLFVFGLFKKIVLADHLSVFVDDVFSKPAAFHWASLLLAAVSYSIQIYFDFSGYSDMAIGCAKCLGFDFKRNFNLPYIAQNVTEFWRRWHISLSTWLKEYLYIPLGGNRKGKARQSLNLLVTMLLGGLWHGANWTFLAWGGIHGIALIVDKKLPHKKSRIAQILGVVVTFIFVTLAWILFRADSFTDAWAVLKGMVTLQNGIRQPFIWSFIAIGILLIATVIAIRKGKKKDLAEVDGFYPILNLETIPGLTAFFVEIGLILGLMYTGENPFVYFQF